MGHLLHQHGLGSRPSNLVKKNLPRILVPLLISALALWAATRNVRWEEVKHILPQARLFPLVLGFLISLVSYYLRGWRWKILLAPFQSVSVWTLIRWQVGGIVINNLLPLRAGEFARAYWAGHKTSVSKSAILATVVVERVFDVGTLAVLTLLLLAGMGLSDGNPLMTPKSMALLSSAALTAGYAAWRIFGKVRSRLPEKISKMADNFISGLHVLKDGKEIAKLAFLSPLIWSIDIGAVAVASRSLGLDLSWPQGGLVMAGLILGVMIPAAPGAVGTYEAGGVQALSLMGFDPTLAFSYVLLLHVFQMGAAFLLGIPSLIIEGFDPKQLYREMSGTAG